LIARLAHVVAIFLALLADAGWAQTGSDASARLERSIDGRVWMLDADFASPINARLEDAIEKGLALSFVVEFELLRPRWYWRDERVSEVNLSWRLSYHPMTREYRLTRESVTRVFASLDSALREMSRVRGWSVVRDEQLQPGGSYVAQTRLRLDTSQLPKPFQVDAMTNRDWNPQVEWIRFPFTPPTPTSAQ
jgi:hypothetical protein